MLSRTARSIRSAMAVGFSRLAGPAQARPIGARGGRRAAKRSVNGPVLVGHRGAGGTAPENTVAAFIEGRSSGADFIEVDVQLSADGVPFLFHDDTPARTTDVENIFPGRASDPITTFTWAELQQLDAGSSFDERFKGERIPHLDDAVGAEAGATGVYIEIKTPRNSPGIEDVVADRLLNHPAWRALVSDGKVQVIGFDAASNRAFSALAPEVPLQQLIGAVPGAGVLADLATYARSIGTNYRRLTARDVARVHGAGLAVSVYTVNSPEDVQAVVDLGVDAVTTDFPVQNRRYLGRPPVPPGDDARPGPGG
ncbi:glycerophosphoryl diester phosphodiesterase [Arthrobacter sp. PL16]|uniref:glycerophosphodiester phosphodiesterase n=1 Tax=Arthrobacter sp. PL16 TaxID=3071720 RepID=UPI002E046B60|nr:glycerophosphoryl diester phosphodiesterase [Arthrobacter sp. PL16]